MHSVLRTRRRVNIRACLTLGIARPVLRTSVLYGTPTQDSQGAKLATIVSISVRSIATRRRTQTQNVRHSDV